MPTTAFTPLKALQSVYDDTTGQLDVSLYFLGGAVTSMLDSYETIDDLPGQLASTGNYDASVGIDAGEWPLNFDTTAKVMELSLPDSTWASDDTYNLSFRWLILVMPGGYVLNAVDFGALKTLTNEPLQLHADESDDIPNSYPVFRWTKG